MEKRNATCAVIGAGDFIGSAIAKRFAAGATRSFAGRRTAEKLEKLKSEIEAAGGSCIARGLDARKEEEVTKFLQDADAHAPLEVVVINPGANVNFPILETTERVFRKVWEMACYAGVPRGSRERAADAGARAGHDLVHRRNRERARWRGLRSVFIGQAGLRHVAQSMARELGPRTSTLRISSSMPVSIPPSCATGSSPPAAIPMRSRPIR
ncbi:MAG: SDR family NAD(P)-dependent oxidoreductase [Rhizomicrobium sp.]